MIYAFIVACVVLTVAVWRWLLADMRRVLTSRSEDQNA